MPSQVVQIPLTGGINQKVATEYLDPSQNVINVTNGTYQKDGGVQKRAGVQVVTGAGGAPIYVNGDPAFGIPERLVTRRSGQELAAINGDGIFSVSPSTGVIASRGLVPPCVATREHIVGGMQQVAGNQTAAFCSFSVAEGSGFRAECWRDQTGITSTGLSSVSGNLYVKVTDLAGTVIFDAYSPAVANALSPQVVIVGSYLYLFFGAANTGAIACYTLDLLTMIWGNAGNVVADALSGWEGCFSATPYVGGSGILFCYGQANGAASLPRYLRLESLPTLAVAGSGTLSAAAGIVSNIAARHDLTNTGVAWIGWTLFTSGLTGANYAACLAVPAWSTTTAAFVVIAAPNGDMRVGVEPMSATQCAYTTETTARTVTTAGAVVADSVLSIFGLGASSGDPLIISRPFRVTSGGVDRVYAMVSYLSASSATTAADGSYVLLDLRSYETQQPLRAVAALAPRQADPMWLALGAAIEDFVAVSVTGIGQPTAGAFRTVIGITGTQEELANGVESTSFADLATLDFTGDTWGFCEAAGETFLSCGVPSFYDGAGVQEMGFLQWPQGVTATLAGSGGALNAGGTNLPYTWAIVYSGVDSAQQMWRSTYFLVVSGTPATNDLATLTIPPLPFSSRFVGSRSPQIEVYRNTQAAQTIFYFVGSVSCPPLQVGGGAYPAAVTFADGTADAVIQTNALLYTTGGLLDSVNPPSFRAAPIRHNERIWGIDDTGFVIWYSTTLTASVAPYFNETLTLQFNEGPLTALGELDGALIVFSATQIWSVSGDGPPLTGQGSTLTTAVPIPTDVGCGQWQSLVSFPGGIIFQAPAAAGGLLYLLDRSMGVTCIGKGIQDVINSSLSVVGAALVPNTTVIRFTLSTGGIVTLDYSFTPPRWAEAIYPDGVSASVVAGGAWCYGSGGGGVYVDKLPGAPLPYYDTLLAGNQWVTSQVILADFKPGGVQGWSELEYMQWIARSLDPCDVTARLTYNYGQTSESRTYSWAATSQGSPAAPGILMGRFSPLGSNAQPMSARLTLTDAPPTGGSAITGQGVRWLGAAFKVSPLGSIYDSLGAGVKQ